jgi:hypothetical protein
MLNKYRFNDSILNTNSLIKPEDRTFNSIELSDYIQKFKSCE